MQILLLTPCLLFSIWIFITLNVVDRALSCNEAVCASIVSKCMLTQSCKCDLKNCTCCRDCYNCLDDLYYECCSCVEMCPKNNETDSKLGQKSHIEDLTDALPELFNVLTEEPDNQMRWVAFTYPAHQGVTILHPKMDKEMRFVAVSTPQDKAKYEEVEMDINCTVVFMSQCMSWMKCKNSCVSMGASSYRWFHDGCCECVGNTCLNYGISESRCLKCPLYKDEDLDELDELEDPEEEIDVEDEEKEKTTEETKHSDSDHEKEANEEIKVDKNEVSD